MFFYRYMLNYHKRSSKLSNTSSKPSNYYNLLLIIRLLEKSSRVSRWSLHVRRSRQPGNGGRGALCRRGSRARDELLKLCECVYFPLRGHASCDRRRWRRWSWTWRDCSSWTTRDATATAITASPSRTASCCDWREFELRLLRWQLHCRSGVLQGARGAVLRRRETRFASDVREAQLRRHSARPVEGLFAARLYQRLGVGGEWGVRHRRDRLLHSARRGRRPEVAVGRRRVVSRSAHLRLR